MRLETVVVLTRVQYAQVVSPSTATCSPFGIGSLLCPFASGGDGALPPVASRRDIGGDVAIWTTFFLSRLIAEPHIPSSSPF